MLLADDGQRLGAAEPRHRVVRDDEVPLRLADLAAQLRGRIHSACENVIAGTRQCRYDQCRIVFPVFDLQQPQRRHVTTIGLHGV